MHKLTRTDLLSLETRAQQRELVYPHRIEHTITLCAHGHAAVADEDMERSNDEKTAAMHFQRFELDPAMIAHWRVGAAITLTSAMPVEAILSPEQLHALAEDFT